MPRRVVEKKTTFGADLIEGMKLVLAHRRGKLALERERVWPKPIDVKAIRNRVKMSQAEFSRAWGIGKRALQEWEQGERQPDSAARAYLTVIAKEPAVGTRPRGRESVTEELLSLCRLLGDTLKGRWTAREHPCATLWGLKSLSTKNWFDSLDALLARMDARFYPGWPNTALHTDLVSPLATFRRISSFPDDSRSTAGLCSARRRESNCLGLEKFVMAEEEGFEPPSAFRR
jgi:putative transcriptional regulator